MSKNKTGSAKVPIANLEAEQSVLGAILLKPKVMDQISDLLLPDDFYRTEARLIYQTMLDLAARGEPVDLVTVTALLMERGQLEEAGGPVLLAQLSEHVGTSENAGHYAYMVRQKADLRKIREIGLKIADGAENGEDLSFLLDHFKETRRRTSALQPITAEQLAKKEFPEPRWVVPGLIPDGLVILAGRPKAGKSWLSLNLGVSVSTGGVALGKIRVPPGGVLYLALEDHERRLQGRLEKMVPVDSWPEHLHFLTAQDFPPLHEGGLKALDDWLAERPEVRLVVIDTLARVKPPRKRFTDSYDHDTAIIQAMQGLAFKHKIAILVIHHTKKQPGEDFVEAVSGTFGLTGAADCVTVLERVSRSDADAVLKITGRDVPDMEKAMKFHKDLGTWEMLGDAAEHAMSKERQDIVGLLKENGPMTPKEISEILEKNHSTTRVLLTKMRDANEIEHNDGKYSYKP